MFLPNALFSFIYLVTDNQVCTWDILGVVEEMEKYVKDLSSDTCPVRSIFIKWIMSRYRDIDITSTIQLEVGITGPGNHGITVWEVPGHFLVN